MRPIDFLIDFLKSEQAHGREQIYLDEQAREGLRNLFLKAKNPSTTISREPVLKPKQEVYLRGSNKVEKLHALREQAEQWRPARELGTLRETMVFATGNPDAAIMLIGEAPGYHEEKEQEPFVGPAGQKLNEILRAMGLQREEVYISNLVKFRPAIPKQATNNRKPSSEEMAACLPLLLAEISVVQPQIILALGGTAAEGMLGIEGTVGSMRGHWYEVLEIPTRVTYHPSYLLQSGSSHQIKRALWEDMLASMEKLGMPISEKQKNFFLPKA